MISHFARPRARVVITLLAQPRVLRLAVCTVLVLAPAGLAAQAPPAPAAHREQTADEQVRHVLNRLAFGPRPGDVARVRAMGVDAYIDEQLHPERLRDTALNTFLAQFPTLTMSSRALMAKYPPPGQVLARASARSTARGGATTNGRARGTETTPPDAVAGLSAADSAALARAYRESTRVMSELAMARIARAVSSERQLNEVLVDFWANHFSVFAGKDRTRYLVAEYERETIRPHVLGSFRELLGAVAKSPAMLYYLDNWQSVADSGRTTLGPSRAALRARANARRPRGVNENYARELLELHTLGVQGGYTQADVQDVARIFTGWTLAGGPNGGGFVFRAEAHDAEAKRVLNMSFPAGGGEAEGERLLDLLAAHPSTARFIAHKLAQRFVSDTPPDALVNRAASTYTKTNGDLRAIVRTIVTSPEFFAADAFRAKVKSPFELVVSAARALGGAPDATPRTALLVRGMGQPLYGRQSPDGWPETGDAWINSGSILARMNFGLAVGNGRLPGARLQDWPAARALYRQPRDAQVDGIVDELFGGAVSPDTRDVLLSGNNPLLPQARADAPTFAQIVGLAIGAPEFQRR